MPDLDNEDESVANMFIYQGCSSTVLERVSMRNSKFVVRTLNRERTRWVMKTPIVIPQTALMKFIRNSPITLRWFRSNLTKDNSTIL